MLSYTNGKRSIARHSCSASMTSLSRTTSLESATSSQASQTDNGDSEKQKASRVANTPSSGSPKEGRPLGIKSRTPSHSLLSSSPSASSVNRKGRFADAGTTGADIGRASISMPPPSAKPSSIYRPLNARRPSTTFTGIENGSLKTGMENISLDRIGQELAMPDDVEKTPNQSGSHGGPSELSASLALPEPGLKPPSDTDGSSNRLSFSSLYSLGSAIYSGTPGAASAPQSTASSNAGSVKSTPLDHNLPNSAPLSPTRTSFRGEVPSSATTATDAVCVIANAQLQHTG